MKSHTGHPDKSDQMKITRRLILRKGGATSLEIEKASGSVSAHSVIARLRRFYKETPGSVYEVLGAEYVRTTENGNRVSRWRMVFRGETK